KQKEQAIQKELDEKNKLYQEKSSLKKSLVGYRENLERVKSEVAGFEKEEKSLTSRINIYRSLLKEEKGISEDYKRARELREEENIYRQRLQIQTDLMREIDSIDNDIDRKRREVEHNIELLNQQIEAEQGKSDKEEGLIKEHKKISK